MRLVKVGVIGIGNMGRSHILQLDKGMIAGATLTAVCGTREEQLEWGNDMNTTSEVQLFQNEDEFLNDADIEAVIIATPHYNHPQLAIKFLLKACMSLEKPAGVFAKNVLEMNESAKASGKVFSIMYNQRSIHFTKNCASSFNQGN